MQRGVERDAADRVGRGTGLLGGVKRRFGRAIADSVGGDRVGNSPQKGKVRGGDSGANRRLTTLAFAFSRIGG